VKAEIAPKVFPAIRWGRLVFIMPAAFIAAFVIAQLIDGWIMGGDLMVQIAYEVCKDHPGCVPDVFVTRGAAGTFWVLALGFPLVGILLFAKQKEIRA
jgi:hypothetical protein